MPKRSNNLNAADVREPLVLSLRLLTAADLSRYTPEISCGGLHGILFAGV